MRLREFQQPVQEYEQGTQRSREIEQVLTQAGYTMLGGGADATAWAKDDGRVIKIIMSEGDSNKPAMKTFKRFLKLTQARPSPHWPRFLPMRDEQGRSSVFAKFRIGNRNYLQIAMEQLEDLYHEEGEMIETMSAYIQDNRTLGQFLKSIGRFDITRDWVEENKKQIPGLWQAMKDAYSKANWDYEWDLHGGNVMRRADGTYVITDPWIRWM
jgi:hypothetical protein